MLNKYSTRKNQVAGTSNTQTTAGYKESLRPSNNGNKMSEQPRIDQEPKSNQPTHPCPSFSASEMTQKTVHSNDQSGKHFILCNSLEETWCTSQALQPCTNT